MVDVAGRPPGASGVATAAGLVALAGVVAFVLFIAMLAPQRPSAPVAPGRLVAGDVVLDLRSAAWTGADQRQLRLQAVISNAGSAAVAIAPGDFTVRTPQDAGWPLDRPDAIGASPLQPGEARTLDLLFDVPEVDAPLDLVWRHANQVGRVQVSPGQRRARAGS